MNINDFKEIGITYDPLKDDRLELIFNRQQEMMSKYHEIEAKNGLLITPDVPVNLHDSKGQLRLKDFAWRITEELGEALEAFHIHPDHPEHFDEEISDALHFLVEFTILAGYSADQIANRYIDKYDRMDWIYQEANKPWRIGTTRHYPTVVSRVGYFVEALAMTCNTLKNKPWKQSQMMTDTYFFEINLGEAWLRFIRICLSANISSDQLFILYFKKSQVNQFRQRSNY